ncbi:alpha/beta fold hydrolase [Paraglaciecola arctica]|uniref:Carboxylesterase n=1 Tax=Paraglaciecola arctica BSs20135 TaxID=493475 RepID=K6YTE4_9ALTE|nr:alpha/beta hydrolase [Paraglaciecola arctica]GAC19973.1 carboxylesterase [Paraglaciecola arctica BSs20135]
MKLIFIHGSGGCKEAWQFQSKHFKDPLALNLPGHPDGNLCTSIAEYSAWLHSYIQEQGFKDIVLVGHSMGGAIALQYAVDYPEALKGIVTIGSGARLRIHPDVLKMFEASVAKPSLATQFSDQTYKLIAPSLVEVLQTRDQQNTPAAFLNDFKACDKFDIMEGLGKITKPLLAVVGDQDVLTPPKYSTFLVNNVEKAQQVLIPGGTHYVFAEKPNEVNQAIENFIQSL